MSRIFEYLINPTRDIDPVASFRRVFRGDAQITSFTVWRESQIQGGWSFLWINKDQRPHKFSLYGYIF